MKQIIILLFLSVLIFSCAEPNSSEVQQNLDFSHLSGFHEDSVFDTVSGEYVKLELVQFGQNVNWILQDGEREGVIDSLVVDEYFKFNDVSSVQLPLNRYVISENYSLFIGMVIGTSIDALLDVYKQLDSSFLDAIQTDNATRILSQHNNVWSVRYLVELNRTYLFSFVSEDSLLINEKFENYESPSDCIVVPEY